MTKAVWGARIRMAGAAVLLLSTIACGDLSRQGTASTYLILTSLEAASGADPGEFAGTLASDVITLVDESPTVFADNAEVSFALATKDPGAATSPQNFITIDRYRVRYIRSDGRNVEGVDVPYGFDGAFTVTVSGTATVGFTLVRVQAKGEAPLQALAANNGVISTIAEVTFFGQDQTGRAVTVSGRISVNFANWGDPA
jgi:hypothetical protein